MDVVFSFNSRAIFKFDSMSFTASFVDHMRPNAVVENSNAWKESGLTLVFITRHQAIMHAEHGIVMANPSVRLSVRLSNAGNVSQRMDISAHFLTIWCRHIILVF